MWRKGSEEGEDERIGTKRKNRGFWKTPRRTGKNCKGQKKQDGKKVQNPTAREKRGRVQETQTKKEKTQPNISKQRDKNGKSGTKDKATPGEKRNRPPGAAEKDQDWRELKEPPCVLNDPPSIKGAQGRLRHRPENPKDFFLYLWGRLNPKREENPEGAKQKKISVWRTIKPLENLG